MRRTLFLAVFGFGEVGEDAEVTIEAGGGDGVADLWEDGTAGFAAVDAVGVTALAAQSKDLAEIVADLLALHINRAEALDARGVDDRAAGRIGGIEEVHLGEGGGVHNGVVRTGYIPSAGNGTAGEGV